MAHLAHMKFLLALAAGQRRRHARAEKIKDDPQGFKLGSIRPKYLASWIEIWQIMEIISLPHILCKMKLWEHFVFFGQVEK